jgi:transposase-like protein
MGHPIHLPLSALLRIILYWTADTRPEAVARELGISENTIRGYFAILLDKAEKKFEEEFANERFHMAVQIDESPFGRRKYNRGRKVKQDWVFGICEAKPGGRIYMEPVLKRDAATLAPIIFQHVDVDALIASDEWAAYRMLNAHYFHTTVCHKANFVDPRTGIHTQRIEALWGSCKWWLRAHKYRDPDHRSAYLHEWCWRYNHTWRWRELWQRILN